MLHRTDVGAARSGPRAVAALVGGEVLGIGPLPDGGTAGLEGDGPRRPAVAGQPGGGELGILIDEVARAADRVRARGGLDQRVGGGQGARIVDGSVAGEERADGLDRAPGLEGAADGAAARLGVQGDGAVIQGDGAAVDVEGAGGAVARQAGLAGLAVAQAVTAALAALAAAAARAARDGIGRDGVLVDGEGAAGDVQGAAEGLAAVAGIAAEAAGGEPADLGAATRRGLVLGVSATATEGAGLWWRWCRRRRCRSHRRRRFR